ncbi:MAG: hypothetical protein HY663_03400 [Chloroflexi bacterium]|nr:hypothetical protein [Chloroflexota bacterium]
MEGVSVVGGGEVEGVVDGLAGGGDDGGVTKLDGVDTELVGAVVVIGVVGSAVGDKGFPDVTGACCGGGDVTIVFGTQPVSSASIKVSATNARRFTFVQAY